MATDPSHVILVEIENLGLAVNRITERICRIEVTVSELLLPDKEVDFVRIKMIPHNIRAVMAKIKLSKTS